MTQLSPQLEQFPGWTFSTRDTGADRKWLVPYKRCFRPSEQLPVDLIDDQLANGTRLLFVTRDNDGKVVAISIVRPFLTGDPETDFVWLSYLGVDPDEQGKGVGKLHMQTLLGVLKDLFPQVETGLFWAISATRSDIGTLPEELKLRLKRLQFYLRLGAEKMPDNSVFFTPEFDSGCLAQTELVWLSFGSTIQPSLLRHVVQQVCGQIYQYNSDLIALLASQFRSSDE